MTIIFLTNRPSGDATNVEESYANTSRCEFALTLLRRAGSPRTPRKKIERDFTTDAKDSILTVRANGYSPLQLIFCGFFKLDWDEENEKINVSKPTHIPVQLMLTNPFSSVEVTLPKCKFLFPDGYRCCFFVLVLTQSQYHLE